MSGRDEGIRIDESTNLGIVITGLEVVQLRILVKHISSVAQGIVDTEGGGHAAGGGQNVAPGVVGILNNYSATTVQNRHHITLEVGDIVVSCAVVGHRQRRTGGIVSQQQTVIAYGHFGQLAANIGIGVGGAAVGPLGPHAVGIVSKAPLDLTRLDLTGFGIDHIAVGIGDLASVQVAHSRRGDGDADGVGMTAGLGRIRPGLAAVFAELPLIGQIFDTGLHGELGRVAQDTTKSSGWFRIAIGSVRIRPGSEQTVLPSVSVISQRYR